MGLSQENAKSVSTPHAAEEVNDETPLSQENAIMYRSAVARLNYLSQDRSDIQFATKELCRFMSNPKERDWCRLKRVIRYLKGHARVIINYEYQRRITSVDVWTDSNYAGCRVTRKSTSGGVVMLGKHMIKSWSITQSVISLSSGEAEYYAMVKGGTVGLGISAMLRELGIQVKLNIKTDASAALGIARRKGLGRIRQIDVSQLWIQDKVACGELSVTNIGTGENISDALTKHVNSSDMKWRMEKSYQEFKIHEYIPAAII